MISVKFPVAVGASFLWIGFVCAISFMEAWLKFKAPGITIPLGLGIGRLVFGALNKIEWVLAIIVAANLVLGKGTILKWEFVLYLVPLLLVLLQTVWLLPALDARAELHIQHLEVPPSNLHFVYVGMEIIKVICLTSFGIALFKSHTL